METTLSTVKILESPTYTYFSIMSNFPTRPIIYQYLSEFWYKNIKKENIWNKDIFFKYLF